MPISDWFKAREQRRYTTPSETPQTSSDVPDGVWVRCEGCKRTLYMGDLERELMVCPTCGRHHDLTAPERLVLLVDEGTFVETEPDLRSVDPLEFTSGKAYADQLVAAEERTGMPEAIVTGTAEIGGPQAGRGLLDFRFTGAPKGLRAGANKPRAFELALTTRRPLVLVTASGGARMQEGMLSLMQMAKTAAAAACPAQARLPDIRVPTSPQEGRGAAHPTAGGRHPPLPHAGGNHRRRARSAHRLRRPAPRRADDPQEPAEGLPVRRGAPGARHDRHGRGPARTQGPHRGPARLPVPG